MIWDFLFFKHIPKYRYGIVPLKKDSKLRMPPNTSPASSKYVTLQSISSASVSEAELVQEMIHWIGLEEEEQNISDSADELKSSAE